MTTTYYTLTILCAYIYYCVFDFFDTVIYSIIYSLYPYLGESVCCVCAVAAAACCILVVLLYYKCNSDSEAEHRVDTSSIDNIILYYVLRVYRIEQRQWWYARIVCNMCGVLYCSMECYFIGYIFIMKMMCVIKCVQEKMYRKV